MTENPATKIMQKMARMMIAVDQKLATMGEMPYGMRKATPAEQKQFVNRLNENSLLTLIEEHGVDDVNKLLRRTMPKEQANGGQMV